MADKLGLDYDEVVILKETSVAHGGVMAIYTDELILTNKKIICLSKGMFGGTKKTYHYPLDQIKVFNGVPQVQRGKLSNGTPSLDIYLVDGEEHFNFQSKNKQTIATWIEEIQKLFGVSPVYASARQRNTSEDDDSVVGAFKEVGEEFKDAGRQIAEAFGFKFKSKKEPVNNTSYIPTRVNSIPTPIVNDGIKCPLCGQMLPSGSRFCTSCGAAVDKPVVAKPAEEGITCPTCGKKLPTGLRFCTECGSEIPENKPSEPIQSEKQIEKDIPKEKLSIDQQIELLQKLKSLVDAGIISPEEFEKKKKEIF